MENEIREKHIELLKSETPVKATNYHMLRVLKNKAI